MSDFCEHSKHKARKQHQCFACYDMIEPGEEYHKIRGVFYGDFFSLCEHVTCHEFGQLAMSDDWADGVGEGYAIEGAHDYIGEREPATESRRQFVARALVDFKARAAAKETAIA